MLRRGSEADTLVSRANRWSGRGRSGPIALVSVIVVALAAIVVGTTPDVALAASSLGMDKDASVTNTSPGQSFTYTLVPRCSGLTESCINAVVTDVIPPEVEITALPTSDAEKTVTYNAATRTLTIAFKIPLTPPSPAGSVGLPAGSSRSIELGVQVPENSTAADGTIITNTATVSADNAPSAPATAAVILDVPRVVRPVATKTWADGGAVAGSGEASTITLGVRNASSSTAEVSQLTVEDVTPEVFDRFDVTAIGPVTFPAGADLVTVLACTLPLSACTDDPDFAATAPQAGPAITLPAGVAAAAVTGLKFVFSNAAGTPLPIDPTGGSVAVSTVLRNTLRSTGATYSPTTRDDVVNCAGPAAVDPVAGDVAGQPDCATYSVQPAQATMTLGKAFFSDTNGDYSPDGQAVIGQNSLVSAVVTATNTSPFPIGTLTITEPSVTSPSEFAKMDVTSTRVRFPSGATQATLAVTCASGQVITTQFVAPPTQVDTGVSCPDIGRPTAVSVTFTGADLDGHGTIVPNGVGSLGLQGRLNDTVDDTDVANGVSDCADGTASSTETGIGAAAASACATVAVQPAFVNVDGVKSAELPTLLPGLPRRFNLSFTNRGTIPATGVVLADPADPLAPGNPFNQLRLASLTLPGSPAATAEVWDPNVNGYVAYDAANADLLARSLGFRVTVTGSLAPGARYALSASAVVREGVPIGARIQNCASVTSDGQTPVSFCAPFSTVTEASNGAAIQKAIAPASSVRPQPGLPGQQIQVKFAAQNTGTLWLKRLVVEDTDTAFFDTVDVTGTIRVNFPPSANRVQVDACTGTCAPGDFVNGTPTASQTPTLPAGVAPADVRGIRITFTVNDGSFTIKPGTNFPTSGACTSASVCVTVIPRATLHSDPATPTPDTLSDTVHGGYETTAQAGALAPIGDSAATHQLTTGTASLRFNKSADVSVAPGNPVPFTLTLTNTGTGAVPDPQIVDPFPTGLDFNPTDPTVPYSIAFDLPAGTPEPPTVEFTPITDPAGRVTSLRWSFPGWDLVPGAQVSVTIQAVLAPGVTAGQTIENRAGGSGDRPDLTCTAAGALRPRPITDDASFGDGLYCTSAAQVETLAGNAFRTEKWVTGDPTLGWMNSITGDLLPLRDPTCPLLVVGGVEFTRYPCVARVAPGQGFDFYLRLINTGTNPATEVRLIDVFPTPGDTGVLLTGEQRGTEWDPGPGLLGPIALQGQGTLDTAYTSAATACTSELQRPPGTCAGGAWSSAFDPAARGFRAIVTFPSQLAPGASTALRFRMVAPTAPVGASPDEVAWNSFAHTEFFADSGRTVQLPPTEPIKTGVALVFGDLDVSKVMGDGSTPATAFGFQYECTVTPEVPSPGPAATPVVVASGSFQLGAGQTLRLSALPARASCAVWEPESAGYVSDAPTRGQAKVVTIPVGGGVTAPAAVAIANDPAPPPTTQVPATEPATAPTAPPPTDPGSTTTTSVAGLGGDLPATGASTNAPLLFAAIAVAAGSVLLLGARRRRRRPG